MNIPSKINRSLLNVFLSALFLSSGAIAAMALDEPTFTIGQQHLHTNGVLISRPDPLDIKIAHLMSVNGIQSLEDYARWLKDNITYKTDGPKDSWSPAEETLIRKSGDCEDYAFLNIAALKVLGFKPQIFILSGKDGYHAICAFQKDGHFAWFDNSRLKETQATSILELAQLVATGKHYSSVNELDLTTRQQRLIYKKI